jgi:hypothetical protein
VVEGGGECDLSNMRTLCQPCHKTVTRELHARLKLQRRAAQGKPLLTPAERKRQVMAEAPQLPLEIAS